MLDDRLRRQLEAIFDTRISVLWRLVRRNMSRGREPLALHHDGKHYWLSCLTDERAKRKTFVGTVNADTTHEDLRAMTGEE